MKLNKKWGFTLIEIMIVIVIISLLAVTLVPKLTGAQARARDVSRIASLIAMKAVFTTIYDDFSEYPLTLWDTIEKNGNSSATPNSCLSLDGKWTIDADYASYLDWWKASFDPQKSAMVKWCVTKGSYWYIALKKNWMDRAAFILSAQVETYQKANTEYISEINTLDWTLDITRVTNDVDLIIRNREMVDLKAADSTDAEKTIYTVIWG